MTSLLTCFILSQWTLYCTENQMKYIYCTEDEIKEAHRGLPDGLNGKESACQCRRCRFDPCVGKIPWRRKWQPTSVFLLGNLDVGTLLNLNMINLCVKVLNLIPPSLPPSLIATPLHLNPGLPNIWSLLTWMINFFRIQVKLLTVNKAYYVNKILCP